MTDRDRRILRLLDEAQKALDDARELLEPAKPIATTADDPPPQGPPTE